MTDETNPLKPPVDADKRSETGEAVVAEENAKNGVSNDGVVASATSDQSALPIGTQPNPVASGEGTRVSDANINAGDGPSRTPLVGERREKVWQELAKLEAKVTEVYGHMHDEVIELITNIRGHLIGPSN